MWFQPCVCSETNWRRRATASEEESGKARRAEQEAEAERRLAERERQERTAECLSWREKHQELAASFRAQEDLKALRQSKAVRRRHRRHPTPFTTARWAVSKHHTHVFSKARQTLDCSALLERSEKQACRASPSNKISHSTSLSSSKHSHSERQKDTLSWKQRTLWMF